MYEMNVYAFREWLQGHDVLAVVGQSAMSWCCPVAQWMHELYGPDFCVSGSRMVYTRENEVAHYFLPPAWVGTFMVQIDQVFGFQSVPVQARQALQILDDVLVK